MRAKDVMSMEVVTIDAKATLLEAKSHTRLETAIAEADALAYWQSAGIVIGPPKPNN